MRKIRLEVEALRVESFQTAAAGGERGTVHGHTGRPCFTTLCYSVGAVDPCNTAEGATCGEAMDTCQHSCSPYILCCATEDVPSCP